MSLTYNTSIVRDGLVLLLDAANPKSYPGTGNIFKNISSKTAVDWIISNTTYNANGYFTFNGTNSGITRGDPIPNFSPDTDLTTLVVWFKPTVVPTANTPVFSDAYGPEWGIWYNTSGQVQYAAYGSSFRSHPINTWCCATMTVRVDGATTYRTCYYNDELIANNVGSGTGNGLHDRPFQLGTDSSSTAARFTGDISCLMLYNRHLTQDEVTRNFNAFRGRYGL